MLRHIQILSLAFAYLMSLSGCGTTDSSHVKVSNATPQDLLRSYQAAVFERDHASILECMEPQLRKETEPMLSAHNDFVAKGTVLERLLHERYGPAKAHDFRDGMYQTINRMFDAVLLWIGPDGRAGRGAKIIQSDNLARVEVRGKNVGIEATLYDSQWLLLFAPDRTYGRYLDAYRRMLIETSREFEHIIKGIRDGTITESNIDNILSGVEAPPGLLDGSLLPLRQLKGISTRVAHGSWSAAPIRLQISGQESWWPRIRLTLSMYGSRYDTYPSVIKGTVGNLNGQKAFGGTPTRDPRHGDRADESFNPAIREDQYIFFIRVYRPKLKYGTKKGTPCKCVKESEIKDCIRKFAQAKVAAGARWSLLGLNCQTFQFEAMDSCCMFKNNSG